MKIFNLYKVSLRFLSFFNLLLSIFIIIAFSDFDFSKLSIPALTSLFFFGLGLLPVFFTEWIIQFYYIIKDYIRGKILKIMENIIVPSNDDIAIPKRSEDINSPFYIDQMKGTKYNIDTLNPTPEIENDPSVKYYYIGLILLWILGGYVYTYHPYILQDSWEWIKDYITSWRGPGGDDSNGDTGMMDSTETIKPEDKIDRISQQLKEDRRRFHKLEDQLNRELAKYNEQELELDNIRKEAIERSEEYDEMKRKVYNFINKTSNIDSNKDIKAINIESPTSSIDSINGNTTDNTPNSTNNSDINDGVSSWYRKRKRRTGSVFSITQNSSNSESSILKHPFRPNAANVKLPDSNSSNTSDQTFEDIDL